MKQGVLHAQTVLCSYCSHHTACWSPLVSLSPRQVIAAHPNICKQLHMPAQSGATTTLQRMRRGYSREAYDALIDRARQLLPGVALSTDIITGGGFGGVLTITRVC
jgi:hypothetical protein